VRTRVHWPDGKQFAFTIFDDPTRRPSRPANACTGCSAISDSGRRAASGRPGRAHAQLARHVLRGSRIPAPYAGAAGRRLRNWLSQPYETLVHAPGDRRGLDGFREFFGQDPSAMANHYNADAIYWGPARLTPPIRPLYVAATAGRTNGRHFGHVPDTRRSGVTSAASGFSTAATSSSPTSIRWRPALDAVPRRDQTVRPAVVRVNRRLERRAIPVGAVRKQSGPPCSRGRALHHVHALRARVCERPRFPCFPMPVQQMGLELTKITPREKALNDWKVASSGTPWSPVEARTNGASEKMLRPAEPPA